MVSCSPSPKAIENAIAQTQAVIPTPTIEPTPTQIPLTELDFSEVIFQAGDLPPGYEPAQIRSELGDITNIGLNPDNFFSQSLSHNNKFGGIVDILVFEDLDLVKEAFLDIYQNMPGKPSLIDVGENARVATSSLFVYTASLTFIRCHVVVSMQFQDTLDDGSVISYAKRLDERLQPLVCR